MAAVPRTGRHIRDWLMAGLAVCCALALPTSIVLAFSRFVEPDGFSVAQGLASIAVATLWAWWMGLGSWRLTYWAKRSAMASPSGVGPVAPDRSTDG